MVPWISHLRSRLWPLQVLLLPFGNFYSLFTWFPLVLELQSFSVGSPPGLCPSHWPPPNSSWEAGVPCALGNSLAPGITRCIWIPIYWNQIVPFEFTFFPMEFLKYMCWASGLAIQENTGQDWKIIFEWKRAFYKFDSKLKRISL